jgi:hypothetical protein
MAGALVGGFHDSLTYSLDMLRLHSSFLWITDPGMLQYEIRKMKVRHFDFEPFRPFSFRLKDTWYRYDTGASIYMALPDKMSTFTEEHFSRYDHIFCGSHINTIKSFFSDEVRELLLGVHSHARNGNLKALKGIRNHINEMWWNIHDRVVL